MTALTKLSNCAASTSRTTSSANAKVWTTPLEAALSSFASPVKTMPIARRQDLGRDLGEAVHGLAKIGLRTQRRGHRHRTALVLALEVRRHRRLPRSLPATTSGTIRPLSVRSWIRSRPVRSWIIPSGAMARISMRSSPMVKVPRSRPSSRVCDHGRDRSAPEPQHRRPWSRSIRIESCGWVVS